MTSTAGGAFAMALAASATLLTSLPGLNAAEFTVAIQKHLDTSEPNTHYVGNRPPLLPSPLIKLPIGSVRPRGWTRRILELQAEGFHGRLPEISRFLTKEGNAWLDPKGRGAIGWEEPVYWLKGFQDCGVLLENDRMIREARLWINAALQSRQPDGWFGPGEERTGAATNLRGREDLWPNMIMLFCLQSYYEQTHDDRVLDLMTAYAGYLSRVPEDRFLVGYWPKMRAGDQLHNLYWLYNRTGNPTLIELAHKVHRHAARWDEGVINWHNVNMAQGFREPAIYYQQTHHPKHLEATYRNWREMREQYGQVPGGMFGGDENCRPGYTGPRQAIETCGIAEAMLSDEILLAVTGDPVWAERCENVAFNTMPASMTSDMKALRYLTAPNQPQSDHVNKSPGIQNGGPMYHMNPHGHRCCQHNSGHAWPYFVQHLWFATPGNGLAAVLYAPCTVKAKVGNGRNVTWTVDTRYPFEETIRMTFNSENPTRFPLYLRLPKWCRRPAIRLNGRILSTKPRPGQYAVIDRVWNPNDRLELDFPMEITLTRWERNRDTVSVHRGPLAYSLKIRERYVRYGGTDAWPAWDIFPDSPWNYGLDLPVEHPEQAFEVVHKAWPTDDQPFDARHAPIELRAQGARIPEWTLDERGLVREVQASPVRTTEQTESITLIPMGAARLRIASFPVIGHGPDAVTWEVPKPSPVRASHCYEGDSVEAVIDRLVPKSSGDHSIPRFTWWPRRGSTEWIERDLGEKRTVTEARVYWFDDTGRGQCRLPESWRVLYQTEGRWRPVTPLDPVSVMIDGYSRARFDPVTTSSLRLEVQLKTGFSGGILEWEVTPSATH